MRSRGGPPPPTGYERIRSKITMTPRRAASIWARSNRERVERLIAEGRMTEAGLRIVGIAKANGSWTALDDIVAAANVRAGAPRP